MVTRVLFCLCCLLAAATCAAETVKFPSLDQGITRGEPTVLTGELFKPAGAGPFPAIVMLHGCGGLYDPKSGLPEARSTWWAEYFQQHGYVALMVDSFKSRGAPKFCPNSEPTILPNRERPLDTYAALRYLQQQAFVRADRVGVAGWSHGGGTALFAIDADSPARPANLVSDFRASVAFYPGWCSTSEQRPAWHSTVPLLVLLGASDNWVLAEPCRVFVEASRANGTDAEAIVYPDTYHDFDWPGLEKHALGGSGRRLTHIVAPNQVLWDDATLRVLGFFDRNLKN
jgi:dienelactone hydrolase